MERVEGVQEARFSWETADGFVTFDTGVTTISANLFAGRIAMVLYSEGMSRTVTEAPTSEDWDLLV